MIRESRMKTKEFKNNTQIRRLLPCPKAKVGEHFQTGIKCSLKKELAKGLWMWPVGGAW